MFVCLKKVAKQCCVATNFCRIRCAGKRPPNEQLELTAYPLGAHIETHGGLNLRTLSYLTVNSQHHSHCELAVTLQLTW